MLLPTLTLVPSAARTVSGNSDWMDLLALATAGGYVPPDGQRALRLQVEVTAISGSGSPTLTVFIEDNLDGSNNNANNIGATSGITTVSRVILPLGPRGDA